MKYIFPILLLFTYSCQQKFTIEGNMSFDIKEIKQYPLDCSVRALEVVDINTVWFAGSGGRFGFTKNRGLSWTIDSIETDGVRPHFRSIAVTKEAVFLLSIASPALLYKSTDNGKNWRIVYKDTHKDIFYDSMAFWNEKDGIAMGDPTEGCLSILLTNDGGENWEKVACEKLPPTEEGEAAFAASNSNIALYEDDAWVVSGGKRSRVFHTPDKGKSWSVYNTPIVQGGSMTGIFTTDFHNKKTGIIFGGDWENKDNNNSNKAITKDGGKTWSLTADGQDPGYRSSVRYLPEGNGDWLLAAGIPGISFSKDGGKVWKKISDENYYTLRIGNNLNQIWVAGDKKIGRLIFKQK